MISGSDQHVPTLLLRPLSEIYIKLLLFAKQNNLFTKENKQRRDTAEQQAINEAKRSAKKCCCKVEARTELDIPTHKVYYSRRTDGKAMDRTVGWPM